MGNEHFEGWVVLELMGHRRLAGYIKEEEICGAPFIRIDIPTRDGKSITQFYSPAASYCITPTTEETARQVARIAVPAPVTRWELPSLPEVSTTHEKDDAEQDEPF